MKVRKKIHFLFLSLSMVLFLSIQAISVFAEEAWKKEFNLPMVASYTGPLSPFVIEFNLGLQMAIDEVNSGGGIAGRKVIPERYDVASKPAEAVLRIKDVAPRSLVVFGPPTSTDGATGGPTAASMKVPFFGGGTAGGAWCIKPENRPWTWMQHLGGEEIGSLAPKILIPMFPNMKRIFVIQETKEKAAIGQWAGAEPELERLGVAIIGRATTTLGDVDFTAQATKAIGAKPDAIWLGCYTNEAGGVIKELRKQGWKGLICGVQAQFTPEIVRIAGAENMEGVLTVMEAYSAALSPPALVKFSKAFKEKEGRLPGVVASIWYDVLFVVKDIFESHKLTNDPKKLQEERNRLVKAMAGKQWTGAGGVFRWKEDGRVVKEGYPLVYRDGELALYKK